MVHTMTDTRLLTRAARAVVTVIVFIFTRRLLCNAQHVKDSSVTCDAPSVEPLANTSVTCHFPENVSETRRIVTVSFYKGMDWRDEDDILECWWLSGRMGCTVRSGYSFNRRISHELTLEIPRVTAKYIGGYACKLSNMNPSDIKSCELNIKIVGKTMCDVPSVPLNSRTSLTCYFPVDVNKTRQDFEVHHYTSRGHKDNIVLCKWKGNSWYCSTTRGYVSDVTTVTNHRTVGIPNAQEDQEGTYSCHLTSAASVRYDNCSLTFMKVTSFCNISSVKETQPTSLTCTFNVDVNATKENFSLVHFGGVNSQGINIVTCNWLKDQLNCTTAPGYKFNNIVTDHLVITVPRASRDHNGSYACHVTGNKIDGFRSCKFNLMPVTSFCNISSVKETKPASLTCTFNVDVNATKSNFSLVRVGGDDSKVVGIVNCVWIMDHLKCTTARGYEFNNIVTDHLVITVPRASLDHYGTYACHVTGTNLDGFQSCDFIFKPDVPVAVLTVVIVVVMLIPVSLVILILVFTYKQRILLGKKARAEDILLLSGKEFSQTKRPTGGGGGVKVYLHAVTDEQAALLTDTMSTQPLKEVKKTTGVDVELNTNPSPVPGMKILNICGLPSQIKAAVSLISQKTSLKMEILAAQEQDFWQKWVEAAFPDLDSSPYFLPPVHVNRVPMTRETVAGQDVLVLQSAPPQAGQSNLTAMSGVEDSDVRYDAALQRLLVCLQTMCQHNKEVLVGLSQLQFIDYLGEPCYAAAARKLPVTLPPDLPHQWKQGDFDVLLIHRHYGLVTCEVKAFGGNINRKNIPQEIIIEKTNKQIRKNLLNAIAQLDRAEAMLSHLVSDVAPGLRVTKTIALPNLTVSQVQQALVINPELTQELCRCLGTTEPADIARLCLCSDQLSDPKTPCDVSSHVLRELGHWWQRRVAGAGPDSHMTPEVYKTLVARFCGPATTVSVPCTSPPRVSVKTLGQAVWCTGECYTAVITLFPEQLHLLNTAPPRLFVTGPPGTGKTVVLLMTGIKWLRCGHNVYIVSTWWRSRAACIMLYHLLLQTVNTQQSAGVSPGQPHLLLCDLDDDRDEEKVVNDLSQEASGGSLYVIADEVRYNFQTVCDKLLTQVPRLHLWAASCYHRDAPAGWQEEYLTRPLRSPPAVVREVEMDEQITRGVVHPYSERGVPDHTDGPPVRRLYHRRQGHSGDRSSDCGTCGREVASFLHSLRVGVTENDTATSTTVTSTSDSTTSPCLQWRDVLVLDLGDVSKDSGDVSKDSGMLLALKEADIPVRVMKDDDIEDVATARSDVVWVTDGHRVQGLERNVVVCLYDVDVTDVRLHFLSRCTAQLVIVSSDK